MPPLPPQAARAAAKAAAGGATRLAARRAGPRIPPPPPPLSPAEAAAAAAQKKKVKRMIMTGAVAAVVIVGTIYGAGLKTRQEWKAEKKKVQEATVDERVAILELHREDLVRQKGEVEAKLAEIRARIKASAEAEEGGAGGGR
ncbi:hypothetical protein NEMBOFW57_001543 [Staphylotrichum longicolle]|uniref:Uncharacterized protein n=1 Tax=Staphylotrichum longicolle TaxID=669026 RepID=A0AAD4F1Q1_9PEZI|nr:hypothetical protein NEMBOFW57_001543 [Staphylotrichum longicolle]